MTVKNEKCTVKELNSFFNEDADIFCVRYDHEDNLVAAGIFLIYLRI